MATKYKTNRRITTRLALCGRLRTMTLMQFTATIGLKKSIKHGTFVGCSGSLVMLSDRRVVGRPDGISSKAALSTPLGRRSSRCGECFTSFRMNMMYKMPIMLIGIQIKINSVWGEMFS